MEVHQYSATELAVLIRKRKLSPVEIVKSLLERIDKLNPSLNAFTTVDYEGALQAAKVAENTPPTGPLHGIPVAIKDLSYTKGLRTTCGSLTLKDNVPEVDSISVERIRRAGAIIIGKTNTPEFGYKGVTDNRLGAPTRNPWNTGRTSGGSSGGSAAAVAAGLVPLAEGTDGAGSIRIPASFCGVVGLKPSFARVPRTPIPDIWYTLSHTGSIARTVADAALLYDVLAGPDPRDPLSYTTIERCDNLHPTVALEDWDAPYLKAGAGVGHTEIGNRMTIGYSPDLGYAAVDPEVAQIVAQAAHELASLHEVVDANVSVEDPEQIELNIWNAVYAARYGPLKSPTRDLFTPELAGLVDEGMRLSGFELYHDSIARTKLYYTMAEYFVHHDLLITPTMAVEAFPIEQQRPAEINGRPMTTLFGWTPFTYPFNLTGQPAVTVPVGLTASGLPVGMQIIGGRGQEKKVLTVAQQYEHLHPWKQYAPIANQ